MTGAGHRSWILLVDMDAFFASVEQAHHPALRGLPIIVCGDPSRRGVVTAASYEARPSGVRAGMPLAEARRRCPEARLIEGNPAKYVALSLRLLQLYQRYTPDVEVFSVDEAFLALEAASGGDEAEPEPPPEVIASAAEIQQRIAADFGLPASIGIGANKLIAKMAAGVNKPRGLTPLGAEGFRCHFWPQAVDSLWGVGPQLAARMRTLGIRTVGDLAHAPVPRLRGAFGTIGPQLREAAWGHDDTPLVPYHRPPEVRSMGHEVTLAADSRDAQALEGTLLRLADQVGRRLRGEGYRGRTVCVKLRDGRFVTRLRQSTLAAAADDPRRIFTAARRLFRELWRGEPVRLLGVTVSGLTRTGDAEQTELFAGDHRARRLIAAADRVRDRLGESALVPAATLGRRRRPGHVPFGAARPATGED